MVQLGDLPYGVLITQVPAVLVSGNGVVVVGTGYLGEPFIWDATNGLRNLRDVLVNLRQYSRCKSCLAHNAFHFVFPTSKSTTRVWSAAASG
jgi:hypothetical protein